jgi:Flp pilus assembly protein TadG
MTKTGQSQNKFHGLFLKCLPSERGSIALEYAIILPVLLLFLIGIIDTGRLIWSATALSFAVETAARCSAITACSTASQTAQYAVNQAWFLNATASNFSVASQTCGVSVSASYTFVFYTPGFGSIILNPTACFPQ